jgi:hypothetical protein
MKVLFKKSVKYTVYGICFMLLVTVLWSCIRYKGIGVYYEGLAAVQLKNGKWGYIDENKKEVIPCIYAEAGDFHWSGLAVVAKESGKYGIIDKSGKVIIPAKYDKVDIYGEYRLATLNNETFVFDSQGNKTEVKFGIMRFGSLNPVTFVDTQTGKKISYRSIVVDDTKVVDIKLVREQGADMVQFVLVASELIQQRQEGSTTVSTFSGSKTVAYSTGSTLNYELINSVLKIKR